MRASCRGYYGYCGVRAPGDCGRTSVVQTCQRGLRFECTFVRDAMNDGTPLVNPSLRTNIMRRRAYIYSTFIQAPHSLRRKPRHSRDAGICPALGAGRAEHVLFLSYLGAEDEPLAVIPIIIFHTQRWSFPLCLRVTPRVSYCGGQDLERGSGGAAGALRDVSCAWIRRTLGISHEAASETSGGGR